MKIESSTKPTASLNVQNSRKPGANRTDEAKSDDVKLSGLAAQLLSTDNTQPFDAARVAEIKQAIAEGRFSINPNAIADRLITSARELVDARRQA
mgnify:FL=1